MGFQIYEDFVKLSLSCETRVGNAVINMYCKCEAVDDAWEGSLRFHGSQGWSHLDYIIRNYIWNGVESKALKLCKEMLAVGMYLNFFSLPLCITSCSALCHSLCITAYSTLCHGCAGMC
ncbi:hypothetical protein NE237_030173 [Protea cynaroides]|uniref:Pentatricopeptide repeat-containing protein n=1 Tax=Protea cynaroides TaxID=273540 RepID=A0A9Q0JVI3_9MAGN|nr:hypothetical protein NE237_030173 [Protea cynaroides]